MKEKKKISKILSGPNKEEFSCSFRSSVSAKVAHSVNRQSRKENITECTVIVRDKTNNFEESHIISAGNYSKKEMQKLREETFEKAIISLYKKRKTK